MAVFTFWQFFLFTFSIVINLSFAYWYNDIMIFVVRQVIFTCVFIFFKFFEAEFKQFAKEELIINKILEEKYSLLRYRFFFLLGLIVGSFLILDQIRLVGQGIWTYYVWYLIGCLFVSSYTIFQFYYLYCIANTPQVHEYFDVSTSIKLHGVRSFATSAKVVHAGKALGGAALGVVSSLWVGPKIVTGDIMHRSDLWNSITYPVADFKSRSEWDCYRFKNFLDRYPHDKALAMKPDGVTVDALKLDRLYEERKICLFTDVKVVHKVNFWDSIKNFLPGGPNPKS